MVAPGSRFVVLLVAFGWLIAPGAASAQAPVGNLVANLTIPGTIGLVSYAPSGSTAAYSERVGSRLVPLGTQCHRGAQHGGRACSTPPPGAATDWCAASR